MLHPGYIRQVLRDRGVATPPSPEQISEYLRALDDGAREQLGARLRRISLGVEASDELRALLDDLHGASARPVADRRAVHAALSSPVQAQPRPQTDLLRQHGLHIYGRTAALKIELDRLGAKDDPSCGFTLQIEGTHKAGSRYCWDEKIQFQLTRKELPRVAAFLLGFAGDAIELANHGPAHDKTLSIHDQGRHLFVRLRQQRVIPVPVEAADAYTWGELALLALQMNRPIPAESQLAMLRRLGRMEAAPARS